MPKPSLLLNFVVDYTDKYHCVYSETSVHWTQWKIFYFVRNRQMYGLNMLFIFHTWELNFEVRL